MKKPEKIQSFEEKGEASNGKILVLIVTATGKIIVAVVEMLGRFIFYGYEILGPKKKKKISGNVRPDKTGEII